MEGASIYEVCTDGKVRAQRRVNGFKNSVSPPQVFVSVVFVEEFAKIEHDNVMTKFVCRERELQS